MEAGYRTFRNWDNIDCEEYYFQSDREIDDPGLNQDDMRSRDEEDFDNSDDFHKHDHTEADQQDNDTSSAEDAGRFDGEIGI
jgi:hypothetical protein